MKTKMTLCFFFIAFFFISAHLFATTPTPTPQLISIDLALSPQQATIGLEEGLTTSLYSSFLTSNLSACDVTLTYDPESLLLDKKAENGYTGVLAGPDMGLISVNSDEPGVIQVSLSGNGNARENKIKLCAFQWKAAAAGLTDLSVQLDSFAQVDYYYIYEMNPSTGSRITVNELRRGDVNTDGLVNIIDALMIARYSVGLSSPEFNNLSADVSRDGRIGIVDALFVAQYYVGLISGFPAPPEGKLMVSDAEALDGFGRSVATSGDGMVIAAGVQYDYTDIYNSGTVYLYRWRNYQWEETKILPGDLSASNNFGHDVALSADGNTLGVGIFGNNLQSSRIYVYKWNGIGWQESVIIPSHDTRNFSYGQVVSVSDDGNTVATSAYRANDDGPSHAFIYQWDGISWHETIISPSDYDTPGQYFGKDVALSGDAGTLAVSACQADSYAGAVYTYKWNGTAWIETKLKPSDSRKHLSFADCLELSADGNTLVCGVTKDNTHGGGAVYVFNWNGSGWEETKLVASDGGDYHNFGNSVSINGAGNRIVVGAPQEGSQGSYAGAVYMYQKSTTGWDEIKYTTGGHIFLDRLGTSVALSGDGSWITAGATGDSQAAFYAGAVYMLKFP